MPEMPEAARSFCTSAAYRLLARRVLLPWALQGIRPAGELLEIGAGSGAMAAELLRRFDDLRVVATDYDATMVAAAQRLLGPWGERATVQQADATELPFPSGRFSLVLSCGMLHHVGNWEQAVAEAVRVLRPGGRLVGFDVLHVGPVRVLHRDGHHHDGEPGATRVLVPGQLDRELARLSVTDVRIRRSVGGLTVRFMASRVS